MEREPAEPEIFTPDNRADEQRYVQEVGPINAEAQRVIGEYLLIMPSLEGHLRNISQRMQAMRSADMPDAKLYDYLRKELTHTYENVSALHRRLGEVADSMTGATQTVVTRARQARESLQNEFERVEDLFQSELKANDAWVKQNAARAKKLGFGQRKTDVGPYRERRLATEQYDEEVMKLQTMVAALESQVELFIKRGKMTPGIAEDYLGQIDGIHERLQELDEMTTQAAESRERRSLNEMMDALRARIIRQRAKAATREAVAARAKIGFVKDSYASVAHLLTEPQRREMRSYLARLTGLMREIEHSRPGLPVNDAILQAISRASMVAPRIVAAVMRTDDKPRS